MHFALPSWITENNHTWFIKISTFGLIREHKKLWVFFCYQNSFNSLVVYLIEAIVLQTNRAIPAVLVPIRNNRVRGTKPAIHLHRVKGPVKFKQHINTALSLLTTNLLQSDTSVWNLFSNLKRKESCHLIIREGVIDVSDYLLWITFEYEIKCTWIFFFLNIDRNMDLLYNYDNYEFTNIIFLLQICFIQKKTNLPNLHTASLKNF